MKIHKIYKQALKLRRQGYSFREIHELIGVAKSTASLWLRGVPLSKNAKRRLVGVGVQGRAKGQGVLAQKRDKARQEILAHVKKDFGAICLDAGSIKLLAAVLYWAEGSKTGSGVNFTNSDPIMIQTFMELMRKGFAISNSKWGATLHLHEYHNIEAQKEFWSRITGIPTDKIGIYKKAHTGINKRPGYPGCIQIRYNDAGLFKYINYMYNALAQSLGA